MASLRSDLRIWPITGSLWAIMGYEPDADMLALLSPAFSVFAKLREEGTMAAGLPPAGLLSEKL